MKNTKKRGFTIVELVIVIAVIAILAAVLIPTFSNVIANAKQSAALQKARNAWTEYLSEQGASIQADAKLCIECDGYFFHVTGGQLTDATKDHTAHTTEDGQPTVMTVSGNTLVPKTNAGE